MALRFGVFLPVIGDLAEPGRLVETRHRDGKERVPEL